MASTTALPPPTSLNKTRGRPTSPAGCFYYKACAGQFTCRLFLLQGLCRSASPPACFATTALSACLCLDPMPASPCVAFAPFHPSPCAPGSSRKLQGLPCRQPHHGTALGSPCTVLYPSIHPFICLCLLASVPSSVLQRLPCRQPHTGTATLQPVHRLCSLRSFQGGGLGLHWCSQPHSLYNTCICFMSQRLHSGSLAPCFFPTDSSALGHGLV